MNSEEFQNLVHSIQNSELLSEIPYNIDLIGFGEPHLNYSGEVHSVYSCENHLILIIIAYSVGDSRMIVTCRFNTISEFENINFELQTNAFLGLQNTNYSIVYETSS